jgi:hypothetical protein
MYIIKETSSVLATPTKLREKKGKLRMEVCLQTVGDINKNRRRYSRSLIEDGIGTIKDRIGEGSFLGELDHPTDPNPVRQVTVLYKEVSHRILETGWDGNKLIATVETVRTPNGEIMKNLAEDGICIGFSFRGMGDVRQISEASGVTYEVMPPLFVVTWDCVSFPSHSNAKLIRVTESVVNQISESVGICERSDGLVCTSDGQCFFPNDFDKLVETRIINLKKRFEL